MIQSIFEFSKGIMFREIKNLFSKSQEPKPPFVHPVLGTFDFERDLGWKTKIVLEGCEAELILGSDGEPPPDLMLQTATAWVNNWQTQHPNIVQYIRNELQGWSNEPNLPIPEKLEVKSINLLWTSQPTTSMIEFNYPGDDIRIWHITFEGFTPNGLAYDD